MANEDEISRETREMLIENARRMRKTPTAAEALLWELLRAKRLTGFKFRRQHIIRSRLSLIFIVLPCHIGERNRWSYSHGNWIMIWRGKHICVQ